MCSKYHWWDLGVIRIFGEEEERDAARARGRSALVKEDMMDVGG